jgi:hypothetical protein
MIPKSFLYRRFLAVVDKLKAKVEGISGLLAVLSDFDPDSEAKGPSSVLPTASAASQNVENQLLTEFVYTPWQTRPSVRTNPTIVSTTNASALLRVHCSSATQHKCVT